MFLSPGIVGALTSGFFVSKSSWTSRTVGFAVGEGIGVAYALAAACSFAASQGSRESCLAKIPGQMAEMAGNLLTTGRLQSSPKQFSS